ncbi:hypothetical protein MLD38_029801 [Melastoma candidum]|uniref:Uncharacterized protein n=1 Tax=Melastoma candidum TaxID=119954 RepID=A0ACB9N767_9MYRT|nr:hypothetical protein MLD38_029801 [Melastoma candidum]
MTMQASSTFVYYKKGLQNSKDKHLSNRGTFPSPQLPLFLMGNNYKFRLSWLYGKLRDPRSSGSSTSKSRSKSSSPRIKPRQEVIPADPNPRKSYHFTRELAADPRAEHSPKGSSQQKSSIGPRKEPHVVEKPGSHVRSSCPFSSSTSTSDATSRSPPRRHRPRRSSPEFRFDRVLTPDPVDKTTPSSSTYSSSASRSFSDPDVVVGAVNPLGLSPILTSTIEKKKVVEDVGTERRRGSTKRFFLSPSAKSPRMRIRAHSPRLAAASRRAQAQRCATGRRRSDEGTNGKCAGVAVVKSSFNPWRDFRDSMVEMIVENRIKESEDLEDLLVCYLSLNSEEYHEVIIAAFKQIWCDLTDVRPNGNHV